jgi:hypothetical protein
MLRSYYYAAQRGNVAGSVAIVTQVLFLINRHTWWLGEDQNRGTFDYNTHFRTHVGVRQIYVMAERDEAR